MFDSSTQPTPGKLEVILDGKPVKVPVSRGSLDGIRSYLEALALENDRVLCSFKVDGQPAKAQPGTAKLAAGRIEAVTVGLTDMPVRMLETALKEIARARAATHSAVTLVLINEPAVARELWWELAAQLKEPLLTLSLLPDSLYQPAPGCASLQQMRKWQLQQLAAIIKAVDSACWSHQPQALSNALEKHVLPWLDRMGESVQLWHQTVLAGVRLRANWDRDIAGCSIGELKSHL